MNAPREEAAPRLVRPYALTGGRTRPSGATLPLEALVMSSEQGKAKADSLTFERAAIVRSCDTPASIADLSAQLGIPLGVARVLVGDLAAESLVEVHGGSSYDKGADIRLLERVLDGIGSL